MGWQLPYRAQSLSADFPVSRRPPPCCPHIAERTRDRLSGVSLIRATNPLTSSDPQRLPHAVTQGVGALTWECGGAPTFRVRGGACWGNEPSGASDLRCRARARPQLAGRQSVLPESLGQLHRMLWFRETKQQRGPENHCLGRRTPTRNAGGHTVLGTSLSAWCAPGPLSTPSSLLREVAVVPSCTPASRGVVSMMATGGRDGAGLKPEASTGKLALERRVLSCGSLALGSSTAPPPTPGLCHLFLGCGGH